MDLLFQSWEELNSALRKTQRTLKQAKPVWETWIVFFLRCLKKQKDNLAEKLERERIASKAFPPLSLTILKLLKEHERLTISELQRLTGTRYTLAFLASGSAPKEDCKNGTTKEQPNGR